MFGVCTNVFDAGAFKAIIPIVNMVEEDWIHLKSSEERNIMIRRAQWARLLVTCGYCMVVTACAFIIILPCFDNDNENNDEHN